MLKGLLIICSESERHIADKLRFEGYFHEVVEITSVKRSAYHFDAARDAFSKLRGFDGNTVVVGIGFGAVVACVLAEQYPVRSLICISSGSDLLTKPEQRACYLMWRRCMRDIFGIICPVMTADMGDRGFDTRTGNADILRTFNPISRIGNAIVLDSSLKDHIDAFLID